METISIFADLAKSIKLALAHNTSRELRFRSHHKDCNFIILAMCSSNYMETIWFFCFGQ